MNTASIEVYGDTGRWQSSMSIQHGNGGYLFVSPVMSQDEALIAAIQEARKEGAMIGSIEIRRGEPVCDEAAAELETIS